MFWQVRAALYEGGGDGRERASRAFGFYIGKRAKRQRRVGALHRLPERNSVSGRQCERKPFQKLFVALSFLFDKHCLIME